MTAFYSWLLGILGVVFLGVMVDVFLPEGKTNSYIKGIFAFITILIIITPLATIKDSDVDLADLLQNSSISINEQYISNINALRIETLVENIEKMASEVGFDGVEVQVVSDVDSIEFNIQKVNIYLQNLVIQEKVLHIDKYQTLVDIVNAYINISKEDVVFYE